MQMTRVGAAVAAAIVIAVGAAGCGGNAEADGTAKVSARPSAKTKQPTVREVFKDVRPVLYGACDSSEAYTCDEHLQDIIDAAHDLRAAMRRDPAGAAFYSPAFVMTDRLETIGEEYHPLDEGMRPEIIGLGTSLARWLDAHPTS
ncbi:hypothetical protein PV342_39685 [Streptomyces sp. PA03-3a]|nr:hypothetical protein [Streptomyces sp. PA03-3a]